MMLLRAALILCVVQLLACGAHDSAAQPVTLSEAELARLEELSLQELLQMTVVVSTPAKVQQTVRDAPASITTIPRSVLKGFGYRTLGDALASVPGIYGINNHVTYDVGVRGIRGGADSWSRLVKVLIDGQPATFFATGGVLLGPEFIPIDAVETIEVIRGPGSALYGGNALLGVINVVTRKAAAVPQVELTLEGGTQNGTFSGGVSAVSSMKTEEGATSASAFGAVSTSALDRSGLSPPGNSPALAEFQGLKTTGDVSLPMSVFLKGTWAPRVLGEFEASFVYQRLDAHAYFFDESVMAARTRIMESNSILRLRHRKEFSSVLSEETFVALSVGATLPGQEIATDDPNIFARRDRLNHAWQAGTELRASWDRYSILGGVDALADFDQGDKVFQIAPDGNLVRVADVSPYRNQNLGLYLQGKATFLEWINLVVGARYDLNSRWRSEVSTRAGVVLNATQQLTVKLLYGSAFQPPAPSQLNAVPLRYLSGIRGNPGLEPQRAHSGELAVAWVPNEFLSTGVTGFWTGIQGRIEFVENGANSRAENITSSSTFGGEATVDAHWKWFFASANLSLQVTDVAQPDLLPFWWQTSYDNSFYGRMAPNFPALMGQVRAGVTWSDLQLTLSSRYVGTRKSSVANMRRNGSIYLLSPYVLLDAHVRAANLHLLGLEIEVAFHLANILGVTVEDGGALGVDIPSLGRSASLSLSLKY